jgi:transposase-like protein
LYGYPLRPANVVRRQAPSMLRDGYKVTEIARALGYEADFVNEVIERHDLWSKLPRGRKLTAQQKKLRKKARPS